MPPTTAIPAKDVNPLQSIEQWEDDVLIRYPEAGEKAKEEFRNYETSAKDATVREFYRLNHKYQTFDFVMEKQKDFLRFNRKELSVWGGDGIFKYPDR
jgi:inositol oxygenase